MGKVKDVKSWYAIMYPSKSPFFAYQLAFVTEKEKQEILNDEVIRVSTNKDDMIVLYTY